MYILIGIGVIYSLQRRSRELRKKRGLPPIEFPDDMPDPLVDPTFVQVSPSRQPNTSQRFSGCRRV